ncbi:Uncharacterised protein, partial [Mycoplasma putrefaciens]
MINLNKVGIKAHAKLVNKIQKLFLFQLKCGSLLIAAKPKTVELTPGIQNARIEIKITTTEPIIKGLEIVRSIFLVAFQLVSLIRWAKKHGAIILVINIPVLPKTIKLLILDIFLDSSRLLFCINKNQLSVLNW